jgi:hypothetical protein
MGIYLNPGNGKFRQSVNSEIYVDKTGLISYTNSVLNTRSKYLCVSRPRRFGKSMAAEMLSAYYDRGASSAELFAEFEIARDSSFEAHRNKYNVLFLNMQQFLGNASDIRDMLRKIKEAVGRDLAESYGLPDGANSMPLREILARLHAKTGIPFIFLIDEWDCIFRARREDKTAQDQYLDFLRDLLKDNEFVALAYMTGILPVKKYGTHSALNMFREFSMTEPRQLSRFVGFTQEEVDALCLRHDMDVEETKAWYNGYRFADIPAVYNPQSVVEAMSSKHYGNYWTKTETYEALKIYIEMNMGGLRDAVIELLAGTRRRINITKYENDMVTFAGYEDVLTLLVHLGYLGYDLKTKEVFIPNKEIADEFVNAVEDIPWGGEAARAVRASQDLLAALWARDVETVAAGVEAAHVETSHLTYNDENALAYTLSLAFYAAREYYTTIRELPTGKGFADLVFLPRPFHPEKPAVLIELKWDDGADTAIGQIKRKEYPAALKDYQGNLLLVGVSYAKNTRIHECVIERHDARKY